MSTLRIVVHDTPAPQGSKRHVGNGRMIESSAKVGPWREAVKQAALDAMGGYRVGMGYPTGPVSVAVVFILRRPKNHYGTGSKAQALKPGAPRYVATRPDVDKLLRSTLDGLTAAAVWGDDAQVAHIVTSKMYAGDPAWPASGALITVWALT